MPHVVCVKVDAKLLDSAAMAFTRAFYLSLLSGHPVKKSFDIAREALKSRYLACSPYQCILASYFECSPYVVDSTIEGEKVRPEYSPPHYDVSASLVYSASGGR